MKTKDFIKGMALAFVAAYLFLLLSGVLNAKLWNGSYEGSYKDLFIGAPIFFLAFASWFLLPVGSLLGSAIPYFARKQSPMVATAFGLTIGVLVGVSAGAITSYFIADMENFSSDGETNNAAWWASFWQSLLRQGSIMSLYSMVWTGTYAYLHAKRVGKRQVAQRAT